jgi:hypothetical protein
LLRNYGDDAIVQRRDDSAINQRHKSGNKLRVRSYFSFLWRSLYRNSDLLWFSDNHKQFVGYAS